MALMVALSNSSSSSDSSLPDHDDIYEVLDDSYTYYYP